MLVSCAWVLGEGGWRVRMMREREAEWDGDHARLSIYSNIRQVQALDVHKR